MDHFLSPLAHALSALLQPLLLLTVAPLLVAWIRRVKARLQNRRGASLLQPYRDLRKLFAKEAVVARTASPLFRVAPYLVFAATLVAAGALPLLSLRLPSAAVADAIAVIGLLGLARFLLVLAGLDAGTPFGGMGSSREMLVSTFAEPALLLVVFTLAMTAHSTNLASMAQTTLHAGLVLRPSYLFALAALLLVAIAECGRIPVDNPATHLELTMIHEGMLLEYSGRHLALMEWAAQLKLALFAVLIVDLFLPWGIAAGFAPGALARAALALALKLGALGALLAVAETALAKMRLFRVPGFLNLAFMLALLGLLSHVILEAAT